MRRDDGKVNIGVRLAGLTQSASWVTHFVSDGK